MNILDSLNRYTKEGKIPSKIAVIVHKFFLSFEEAIRDKGEDIAAYDPLLNQFLDLIIKELGAPIVFESYHEALRTPYDYYQFGLELFRPLIIFSKSTIKRAHLVDQIVQQLANGDNAILLANHQTEPDPQAISLLLEKTHSRFAEEMIFVAGQRVITDPLAVPFSKGRNLLCIFSRKYIENPPEQKPQKLLHNQRTMKKTAQLLAEGGKCIYVAPSGGRDRPNQEGKVEVAPFDPDSIEMFWLMAQQAKHLSNRKTHFYPLALSTYDMLPPPHSTDSEIGERRHARSTPIHLAFGEEIDMENFPGSEGHDKKSKRKTRADYIWNIVREDYYSFPKH